jgi:pimeloyl-ACP methyl ester carboxylesterase
VRADEHEKRYRAAERRYWDHEGVPVTEEWARLPRAGTRARLQVVGDGPPVLFVHGGSVSGTCWAPLVARLRGFRCLVLDRPGCGLSEPLTRRVSDLADFAALADSLVVDVLDGLGLERAHLVATSVGGYHALRSASVHPDRIGAVMELGFPIGAPIGNVPLVMRLSGVRTLGRLMARVPMTERAVRSMLAQIGLRQALQAGRLSQEGVDWFRATLRHTSTMRHELDSTPILRPLRGLASAALLDDGVLGAIRSPVHFVWGENDPFGGADIARPFVARIPGAALEMIPGGHAVWLDDADGVAATTQLFLSGRTTALDAEPRP